MGNFCKIATFCFVIVISGIHGCPDEDKSAAGRVSTFDPNADAFALIKALNHTDSHKRVIIDVIARRTMGQRRKIAEAYRTNYGRILSADLESRFSGNSRKIIKAMMTPLHDYLAEEFDKALWGSRLIDEKTIVELLCTLDNDEILAMARAYERLKGKTLRYAFGYNNTWGRFKRLGISLMQGEREVRVDENEARDDAQRLYKAGGASKLVFYTIFTTRSYDQLRNIFIEYQRISGCTIGRTIENKFRSTPRDLLLGLVERANGKNEFFARKLFRSMKRLGRKDRALVRIIVARSEIDLGDINEKFAELYGKSLENFIEGNTSGYYQYALLTLVRWTSSFSVTSRDFNGGANSPR